MRIQLAIFAILASTTSSLADEVPFGPRPGVLLLRNGEVIAGKILREGDRYDVTLEDGDLRVRASEVDRVCDSLEACYDHLRTACEPGKVTDHLELAEWCLRHELFSLAGQELRDAIACDPKHPKIGLIERRLKLAAEQVSAEPNAPAQSVHSAPANDELDRMVRGMPPGTVETFASSIQPMLINHCGTAACHGPTSTSSFKLLRIPATRTQTRRATQRNLHAALAEVDLNAPEKSPLLTMPIQPHGPAKAAVFTNRETQQYRQLVEWAFAVASRQREVAEPAKDPQAIDWSAPIGKPTTIAARYRDQQRAEEPSAGEPNAAPRHLSTRRVAGQAPSRSEPKRGELPQAETPQDPFDPEAFNREFSPE